MDRPFRRVELHADAYVPFCGSRDGDGSRFVEKAPKPREVVAGEDHVAVEVEVLPRLLAQRFQPRVEEPVVAVILQAEGMDGFRATLGGGCRW